MNMGMEVEQAAMGLHTEDPAAQALADLPPSTVMLWPVTNEAASEHSQTTASAISSGVPIRPTGCGFGEHFFRDTAARHVLFDHRSVGHARTD